MSVDGVPWGRYVMEPDRTCSPVVARGRISGRDAGVRREYPVVGRAYTERIDRVRLRSPDRTGSAASETRSRNATACHTPLIIYLVSNGDSRISVWLSGCSLAFGADAAPRTGFCPSVSRAVRTRLSCGFTVDPPVAPSRAVSYVRRDCDAPTPASDRSGLRGV